MKVWRLVSGSTYMAVGHEGPHPLTGGVLNTFPASVPVEAGDFLGANNKRPADSACVFSTPGVGPLASMTDLADGDPGAFSGTGGGKRVNISAVVTPTPPSNEFEIGELKGKKLTLTVPGPGEVEVSDAADTSASGASAAAKKKRLKPSSATASGAGEVTVKLRLTKSAKQKLKRRRKVKANAAITFTPTGGTANTETAKLKVKKKK
jgi:hypothetical protein